ncbi:Zinc finger protein 836 [Nymphon striatum]|nr:Zinc finger protein 836 [Nymphon striatum]
MKDTNYLDLITFLNDQQYPLDANESTKRAIKKKASNYFMENETLFYRGKNESKRQVIFEEKQRYACFLENHFEDGNHLTKEMTIMQMKSKFYWKSIFIDCNYFFSTCVKCFKPENSSHQPWDMVEVSVHGPYPVNSIKSKYILKVIDCHTNWTILKTISEYSISEIMDSIIDVFFCFGWPGIVNFVNLNQIELSELVSRIQETVKLVCNAFENIDSELSPEFEVPNICATALEITGASNINEIMSKACEQTSAEFESISSTVFITQSNASFTEGDVSVWQEKEIEDFVHHFPEKWTFILPYLGFKFNHAIYSLNSKMPFNVMFNHLSMKIFPNQENLECSANSSSFHSVCEICKKSFPSSQAMCFHQRKSKTCQKYFQNQPKNTNNDEEYEKETNIFENFDSNLTNDTKEKENSDQVKSSESRLTMQVINQNLENTSSESTSVAQIMCKVTDNPNLKLNLTKTHQNIVEETLDGNSGMDTSESVIESMQQDVLINKNNEPIPQLMDLTSHLEENIDTRMSMDRDSFNETQEIHVTVIADDGEENEDFASDDKTIDTSKDKPLLINKGVSSKKRGQKSCRNKVPPKCDVCSLTFISSEKLKLHEMCHREGKEDLYCSYCEFSAQSWSHIFRHLASHNIPEIQALLPDSIEKKNCTPCDRIVPPKASLRRHIQRVHNPRSLFHCSTCNVDFKERKTYIRHVEKHDDHEFSCELCTYKTKSSRNYQLHLRKHNICNSGYMCNVCGKYFSLPSLLKSHKQAHEELPKSVMCEHCGLKLKSTNSLKVHIMRIHGEKTEHPCDQCDYVGKSQMCLKNHIKRKHNKKFQCNQCDYATTINSALVKHLEMFHNTESRPYMCSQCKYRSKHMKQLTEHVRARHNPNMKRYQCQCCHLKFKTLTLLRDHMPVHTGELIYGCKICGYRAKHRQTAYAHIKSKHKDNTLQEALDTPGPDSIKLTKMMIVENRKRLAMQQQNQLPTDQTIAMVTEKVDNSMYDEYASEEIIVQSDQSFLESQSYVPINELQAGSILTMDQANDGSIVLHDGTDKEIKLVQLDGGDVSELTFQDSTLQIVNQQGETLDNNFSVSECDDAASKSVELYFYCFIKMGKPKKNLKSKSKSQQQPKSDISKNLKVKGKSKAVTTNLKRFQIKSKIKSKTEESNKKFSDLRSELIKQAQPSQRKQNVKSYEFADQCLSDIRSDSSAGNVTLNDTQTDDTATNPEPQKRKMVKKRQFSSSDEMDPEDINLETFRVVNELKVNQKHMQDDIDKLKLALVMTWRISSAVLVGHRIQ